MIQTLSGLITLDQIKKRKIVIVLTGGGARGSWQWDLLRFLEAAGIEAEIIGGASAGGINAYLWAKGFREEGDEVYDKAYSDSASPITKTGIGSIKNGRLKINWFKLAKELVFGWRKIRSLMDNGPLLETVKQLELRRPGWRCEFLVNAVSMKTGKGMEYSSKDLPDGDPVYPELVVATSNIPIVWPIRANGLADGGLRFGLPLAQMFKRMDPNEDYLAIVISANRVEMEEIDSFDNIFQMPGRIGEIFLNQILVDNLGRTMDRNEEALRYGERSGRRYVPIIYAEYSGKRGIFEFTSESRADQKESAKKDAEAIIKQYKELTAQI